VEILPGKRISGQFRQRYGQITADILTKIWSGAFENGLDVDVPDAVQPPGVPFDVLDQHRVESLDPDGPPDAHGRKGRAQSQLEVSVNFIKRLSQSCTRYAIEQTLALCYKTFCGRNLRILIIS